MPSLLKVTKIFSYKKDKQGVQGIQAFGFFVVTFNDKSRFKRKRRG